MRGLQLDYIRYPDDPACYCEGCRRRFETARGGSRVRNWPADVLEGGDLHDAWLRWRSQQITSLIAEIRSAVKRTNPRVHFSATCFRDLDRAYRQYGQDVRTWAQRRIVDSVMPMDYEVSVAKLESRLRSQRAAVGNRILLVPGLGSYRLESWRQLAEQIALCRRYGLRHVAVYAYDEDFVRTFGPALRSAGSPRSR